MIEERNCTWFVRQRLEWIGETLRVFGCINRIHLERKFGISTPQASNDLALFQKLYPDAMLYNAKLKAYFANFDLGDVARIKKVLTREESP